ncbi:MAG: hypothetical protein V1717_02045, partial [Candidatus Micrarchaeota archaeon]
IVIPLTITVGREFQSKLPLLVGLLLLFSFSLVLFDKTNVKTTDLSDLQRVQYNVPKVFSLSMVLFLVVFSLSLAIGMYYSMGLGWAGSLLVLPATFVLALVLGLAFYPWLLTTFLSLALVVSFCSFLSSFWSRPSIASAWAVLSAGMLLFAILAFLVVFYKVSENKDAHVNLFLDSLVSQAGSAATIPISGQLVSSAVSKEDFKAFITQDSVRELLAANYPGFSSLSDSEKTVLVEKFHAQSVDSAYNSFTQNSGAIAQSLSSSLSQILSGGPGALKQQIYLLPQFKTLYDRFAFLLASIAALTAAFVGILIQIIAIAFLFAMSKVLPFQK